MERRARPHRITQENPPKGVSVFRFLRYLVLAASFAAVVSAHADAWPGRPVRILVPASAGTAPDIIIRVIAERIGSALQKPIVVENRPGAGGIPAMQALQAANDDHTFLLTLTSTTTVAPMVLKGAERFDYRRDVEPVAELGRTTFMIVANPKSSVNSLAELIANARQRPGAIAFGTPPLSSIAQLSVEILSRAAGVKFNMVPFLRSSDSLTAVASGDTEFFVDTVSVVMPFVRAQKVKPIALLAPTGIGELDKVPLANKAVPGVEVVAGFGLVGKKGLDGKIVEAMGHAVATALSDREVVQRLEDLAVVAKFGGPDAYRATLRKESEYWGNVVRQANAVPR